MPVGVPSKPSECDMAFGTIVPAKSARPEKAAVVWEHCNIVPQSDPQQSLDLSPVSAVSFISISLQWTISTLLASPFAGVEQGIGLAIPCPANASPRRTNRKTCLITNGVFIVSPSPSTGSSIVATVYFSFDRKIGLIQNKTHLPASQRSTGPKGPIGHSCSLAGFPLILVQRWGIARISQPGVLNIAASTNATPR